MRVEGKKREDGWENKADRKVAVEKLNLNLETLSNPCLNLAGITKMDLSNNHLELLPESMTARLVNVVVLDLQSNQLRMLPNSIGCLSKLKFLNVSANLIESFPRSIEDCKALEELNANFNKLTKLPDTMGFELLNLQKLCVNSNKLAYLPYSTSHLTSLCFLDAHLNCLRSLPEGLENLIHLQVLNISKNFQFLESIPYSLGLLTSLVELDISYNRITHLPISFGCLTNLCKFKAEGNPLVFPPMEVLEQSVEAMREYLSVRMNGVDDDDVDSDMGCVRNNNKKEEEEEQQHKSKSWVGKQLVKFRGSSCVAGPPPPRVDRVLLSEYRSIDGMSTAPSPSPHHYMGMFSPRRLFSPIRSPFRK